MPYRKINKSKARQFSYLATLIGLIECSQFGGNLAIRKAANKDVVRLVQRYYGLKIGKDTPKPQLARLDTLKRRDHLLAIAAFRQRPLIEEEELVEE